MSNLLLDRFLPFRFKLMKDLPLPSTVAQARTASIQATPLRQQLRSQLTAFSTDRTEEALRTVNSLSEQIRKADKSQPGAFVTFRKPD
jgi:hypothetical protein